MTEERRQSHEPGPELHPELRRPGPTARAGPELPGYQLGPAVEQGDALPGVRRWRARREGDGLEVTVTCLDTARTPQEHAAAVQTAAALSRVHHPHLESLRDIVPRPVATPEPFGLALVTVPVDAESLESLLGRHGSLAPAQALSVLAPLAEAMAHLHDHGFVHAALTPSCVHITASGMPLVTDTAIPLLTGRSTASRWARDGYVAPEVSEGFPPTRQSDAYALAAVAWRTFVGRPPRDHHETLDADNEVAGLPAWLTEMLRQGLSADPEARPKPADWLDALPQLGRAAPVDVLTDLGDDLPQRLRRWAASPPRRHRVPQHRAESRRAQRRRPNRWRHAGTGSLGTGSPGAPAADPSTGSAAAAGTLRARWALTVLVVLVALAVGAGVVGALGTPLALPSQSERAAESGQSGAASSAAVTAPPGSRQRPASSTGSASPQPARVVQSLLDARGSAWESGSIARLDRASLRGSMAWRADREDLQEAAARGVRFEQVHFRALETTLLSGRLEGAGRAPSSELLVRATVRRAPVLLRDAGGEQHRYPATTETVELTLRRGGQGWRLYDWG